MSITRANAGDVIDLAVGSHPGEAKNTVLAKTANIELVRMVLAAGKKVPVHKSAGELTVQCLEGRISFTVAERTRELAAGQMLYLEAGEAHSLVAVENSSLLLTMLLHDSRSPQRLDVVQEASEESFPASDAPA